MIFPFERHVTNYLTDKNPSTSIRELDTKVKTNATDEIKRKMINKEQLDTPKQYNFWNYFQKQIIDTLVGNSVGL